MKKAILFFNSAHFTKDKPNGKFWNLHIPVELTGETKEIDGEKHHEVLLNGQKHWVSEYALIVD